MQTVTACIIERAPKEVLICSSVRSDPLNREWEFPSGVADPGEAPEAAMRRVALQWLGLAVDIHTGQPPFTADYDGEPASYRFFLATILEGELRRREYKEIRWVSVVQLREYDYIESHRPVVEWYLS